MEPSQQRAKLKQRENDLVRQYNYQLPNTTEVSTVYIRRSEIGAQKELRDKDYVTCKKNKIVSTQDRRTRMTVESGATPRSSTLKHVRHETCP